VYKHFFSGLTPENLKKMTWWGLPYAAGQTLRSPGATSKHASFGHAHTCEAVTYCGWLQNPAPWMVETLQIM